MKRRRVPGDIIDARQEEPGFPADGVPDVAVLFIIIGAVIVGLVWLQVGDDDNVRRNDLEFLVEHIDY